MCTSRQVVGCGVTQLSPLVHLPARQHVGETYLAIDRHGENPPNRQKLGNIVTDFVAIPRIISRFAAGLDGRVSSIRSPPFSSIARAGSIFKNPRPHGRQTSESKRDTGTTWAEPPLPPLRHNPGQNPTILQSRYHLHGNMQLSMGSKIFHVAFYGALAIVDTKYHFGLADHGSPSSQNSEPPRPTAAVWALVRSLFSSLRVVRWCASFAFLAARLIDKLLHNYHHFTYVCPAWDGPSVQAERSSPSDTPFLTSTPSQPLRHAPSTMH